VAINKKSMKCNVPRRQVSGGKKFVVKACQGGEERIVRFGDSNMTIKKSTRLGRSPIVLGQVELRVRKTSCLRTTGVAELGIANG